MRRGDISCNLAPVLAFNLNVLIEQEPENKLKKLFTKRKLNLTYVKLINTLWSKYNYRIFIISTSEHEGDLEKLLRNYQLNYSRFEHLTMEELEWKCQNEFTYYYDTDYNVISSLNSKSAQHINDLRI